MCRFLGLGLEFSVSCFHHGVTLKCLLNVVSFIRVSRGGTIVLWGVGSGEFGYVPFLFLSGPAGVLCLYLLDVAFFCPHRTFFSSHCWPAHAGLAVVEDLNETNSKSIIFVRLFWFCPAKKRLKRHAAWKPFLGATIQILLEYHFALNFEFFKHNTKLHNDLTVFFGTARHLRSAPKPWRACFAHGT